MEDIEVLNFNKDKYKLICLHVQTIPNINIHEIINDCGVINGHFFLYEQYRQKNDVKQCERKLYLLNAAIAQLNKSAKTSYTISDFID